MDILLQIYHDMEAVKSSQDHRKWAFLNICTQNQPSHPLDSNDKPQTPRKKKIAERLRTDILLQIYHDMEAVKSSQDHQKWAFLNICTQNQLSHPLASNDKPQTPRQKKNIACLHMDILLQIYHDMEAVKSSQDH